LLLKKRPSSGRHWPSCPSLHVAMLPSLLTVEGRNGNWKRFVVRSALGLAKWLIHVKHFSAAEVRSAVDQWLHYVGRCTRNSA